MERRMTKNDFNYYRIEKAIRFIKDHAHSQPTLEQIANHVSMSATNFQKMFTNWAGISPKSFLQYLSIENAKRIILDKKESTLIEISEDIGLSSTSRLHDLFIKIERMTPGQFLKGAKGLTINYNYYPSIFGDVIIASTTLGICFCAFIEEDKPDVGLQQLKLKYPKAELIQAEKDSHISALDVINQKLNHPNFIKIHLIGTDFQIKVWEALLKIPSGNLLTYGKIAHFIESPKSSRAVGTAIGSNPIAYLIPCHRVIQSTGNFGGYMWGSDRKSAIIGLELSKQDNDLL